MTSIAFVHALPNAIAPLADYYSREAPEYQITNLLDDGLLRSFAAGDLAAAEQQVGRMIRIAREAYKARLALVTCSALPLSSIRALADATGLFVVKIDEEMARRAVTRGRRIGVIVTFEPTVEPARKMLLEAAADAGREVELALEVYPQAQSALMAGKVDEYDAIMLEGVHKLESSGADCIVLAQVSMARVLQRARDRCRVPVFTSLETSLEAVRRRLLQDRLG